MAERTHHDYPHEYGHLQGCPGCDAVGRRQVARRAHIDPADVGGVLGEYTIDGMDADDWIQAMRQA